MRGYRYVTHDAVISPSIYSTRPTALSMGGSIGSAFGSGLASAKVRTRRLRADVSNYLVDAPIVVEERS